MPKPKAINRKTLVAFVLPIIRKEKFAMNEELEKLKHKQYVAERKPSAGFRCKIHPFAEFPQTPM